jgi:hypothetical protein
MTQKRTDRALRPSNAMAIEARDAVTLPEPDEDQFVDIPPTRTKDDHFTLHPFSFSILLSLSLFLPSSFCCVYSYSVQVPQDSALRDMSQQSRLANCCTAAVLHNP